MRFYVSVFRLFFETQKRKSLLILLLMVFSGFIDATGVASIMPFMTVVSDPSSIDSQPILKYTYELFGFNTHQKFFYFLGSSVFLFLIFSLVIKALTTYVILKFTLMSEYRLSKKLLDHYLSQPYKWFFDQNSADLSANVLSEVSQLINRALLPIMQAFSQVLVVLSIVLLLFVFEPSLTFVIISVLFGTYFLIFKQFQGYLSRIGKQRYDANQERFGVVNMAFGAIKEIKLRNLEPSIIKDFSNPAETYAKSQSAAEAVSHLPRFLIEAIAFGGIVAVILYLMSGEKNFSQAIPIISLYAFAGYKLLPALQQVYRSSSQISFSGYAAQKIILELKDNNGNDISMASRKKQKFKFKKSVKFQNVTFSYNKSQNPVVSNLDLEFCSKKLTGVVGVSGSGKSTVIDLLFGLLEPDFGIIKIDGIKLNSQNTKNWWQKIGYVPQDVFLLDDTIACNIAFGKKRNEIDLNVVKEAAKLANLHRFVSESLEDGYNTVVGENGSRLSGGQRQRIGIARALYNSPEILVFDEATSALDVDTEREVMKAIENIKNEKTLIIVTHRMDNLRQCDHIVLLGDGKLLGQGTFVELLESSDTFRKLMAA